jgi:hypothetical protein
MGAARKLVSQGHRFADDSRALKMLTPTYQSRQQLKGDMNGAEAKPLKELEQENSSSKKILTDAELGKRSSRT